MNLNGKQVSLHQLEAELAAAGVAVRALGVVAGDLHTYDDDGAVVDVPPGAAAVIAAHVPVPTEDALATAARALKAAATTDTILAVPIKQAIGALVDALVADRAGG